MAQKRRPKYIEELIETVNHEMWNLGLKYDESNRLFFTIQEYLIHHGWYRGFNYFHDELRQQAIPNADCTNLVTCTLVTVKVLHGSDQGYEYVQFM